MVQSAPWLAGLGCAGRGACAGGGFSPLPVAAVEVGWDRGGCAAADFSVVGVAGGAPAGRSSAGAAECSVAARLAASAFAAASAFVAVGKGSSGAVSVW